jgi:hypothetical protein
MAKKLKQPFLLGTNPSFSLKERVLGYSFKAETTEVEMPSLIKS